MPHGVNEDGQQKIGGFWSKLAKEWRCAAVYAKKTQEFKDIIKASVLEASTEPTVKKRPVGLTKVQTDSNVKILFHVHTGWQDKNIILMSCRCRFQDTESAHPKRTSKPSIDELRKNHVPRMETASSTVRFLIV